MKRPFFIKHIMKAKHKIEIEVLSIDECVSKYFTPKAINDDNCYIWCISWCNRYLKIPEVQYPVKRLVFDDIDTSKLFQTFRNEDGTYSMRALRTEEELSKYTIFNNFHVDELIEYLNDKLLPFREKKFVICCEAGISRSAAIAEFLAQVFSEIFNDYTLHYEHLKRYAYRKHPNMTVLNKLNENRQRFIELLSNKIF